MDKNKSNNQTFLQSFLKSINGVTVAIAILTAVIGWQVGHYDVKVQWSQYKPQFNVSNQNPPAAQKNLDFSLFWQVWDMLSKNYVDKKALDAQKMYYGAIQGMVAAIGDPYTVFLPPASQKSIKEELGGSFDGIGLQLEVNKDKRLFVISALKDTPSDKAGIKPGDLILKIDGKDASSLSLYEAVDKIRGQKGTNVTLNIYHEGDSAPKDVTLKRDTIVVKSVELTMKTSPQGKKIAYIQLTRFGERTFSEWDKAISDALAQAPNGVIVDVRNNPGGFLDGAQYIGSEFIDKGNIVQSEDANGTKTPYPVKRIGKMLDIPMEVMINKGSASASEIVAGAIQDDKRGKLIGDQSFGKGTIQESQELPGGTGIHITVAKWLTPNGRWIHGVGLTPDVKVEATGGADLNKDLQLDKALSLFDNP